MDKIGGKLKDLLKKRKMQSKELGERMGLSKVTISHWANNYNSPSLEQLEQISRILRVPISYWFDADVSGGVSSQVNGDGSAASIYGDAIVAGELATCKMENDHLKAMLDEKERLIQVLLEKNK